MECKRARPSHLCGAPELFARSYPVHLPWPHGTTDFVLEERPGKCDLFGGKPAVCCDHTVRLSKFVEPVVDDVVASFLAGCHRHACRAVDLGANIGLHTMAMLNMGATVIAVEPQPDLVDGSSGTKTKTTRRVFFSTKKSRSVGTISANRSTSSDAPEP